MFDDDIYYDYNSIVNDADPLYDDEDYSCDEYDRDSVDSKAFDYYYHSIADELVD
jgi:heat shock protein HspQ